jgi:hypothetical protein
MPTLLRDFWLVVITGLVVLALANQQATTHEVRANQRNNTQALCAYRDDIERRYDTSVKFLLAHPKGFAGISVGTLRVAVLNEASTLKALNSLTC